MKIALITGGSRGLGKSMALHLAQKGHDVIITYQHSKTEAQSVVDAIQQLGQKAALLQLDIAQTKTFPLFFEAFKALLASQWNTTHFDILINNAGIGINTSFMETTEEQFDTLMNIHLKGTFFFIQTLLPILNDGGTIINISSGLARFSLPGFAAYAMMKGGIEVLTRYLALELGKRSITVNVLAPGAIATDFGGGVVRDNENANAFIASQTALGRVGLADDIGAAVSLLVSDEAHWINGERIEVSGGMRL
ncbi:SDR family oxidoreductase [Sulfurospirillum diekertiae]|uniref:3-oxoacyl-[acyl-carrier-protein] reductase FabG n=1 Tax=Sulfurospirillum diekertiae TaxID=1854492 RepID=A0A290HS37_9BACT|nr:SDR family oxidoreductase [Sulfurospirillum diekertiae]ATB68460.1 putative 3-oxoacyl-[acyl-carrier-protein] reductase FabG [Sulfurospirillum diekertiae]QIR76316.1 SDR family oxidoreductase [Sulfurospirillum diekertiae]QIR78946.1 SDR family oxidoreductase [Sulfurospirillum diekertiae]